MNVMRGPTSPTIRLRGATVILTVASLLCSCGLPGGGDPSRIEDDSVPYHLLELSDPTPDPTGSTDGQPTVGAPPWLFWTLDNGRLTAETAGIGCSDDAVVAAQDLLAALSAGPGDDARSRGLSTALPLESDLMIAAVTAGIAEVDLDPAASISADRLPAAVGQIVSTLTSARGVTGVRFVSAGAPLPVPLPGGALTDAPVTASDYAELLPGRYRDRLLEGGCSED